MVTLVAGLMSCCLHATLPHSNDNTISSTLFPSAPSAKYEYPFKPQSLMWIVAWGPIITMNICNLHCRVLINWGHQERVILISAIIKKLRWWEFKED